MNKKIAVIGIGGVGGYLAGMLANTYDHVSLVARGKRRESIQKNGLVLYSDYNGELVAYPENVVANARELGVQDYIFICVKNYSLEEVCKDLAGCVDEHTVIVPVMNGVDPGERTRTYLQKGTVVDSLIYIVSFAKEDYSIVQQDLFANLKIGIQNASEKEREKVQAVKELLQKAKIDCEAAEDIEAEIWKKYMLNCAYNVMTAFYRENIGTLRSNAEKVEEYRTLLTECYSVASVKGVHIQKEFIETQMHRFLYELADDATSSLQRDVEAGKKQTELETFCGYLVREGRRLGVPVPLTERFYVNWGTW